MKWMVLILSPLGAISSSNWILMWTFLELSSFSFILILEKKKNEEKMKYFLIQTLSSIILLLCINLKMNMSSNMYMNNFMLPILLILSLSLKSGVAPAHFWMPEIARCLKGTPLGAFLSIQKLAPLFILVSNCKSLMTTVLILFSTILGVLSQLSSLSMSILLTYSSVSHISWMIMAGMLNNYLYFLYFIIYTLILFLILNSFSKFNTKNIISKDKNFSLMINLLSFSGIPPLLGFFPKWMVVMNSTESYNLKPLLIIMIMMSCLNMFIYIRIFTLKTINTLSKEKSTKMLKSDYNLSVIFNTLPMPALIFNSL